MKVVILYEKTGKKISETAAHIIESHECDVVYRQVDTIWDNGSYSPTVLLHDASHILFIFGKHTSTLNPAFIFFLGLGIGKKFTYLNTWTRKCRILAGKLQTIYHSSGA
ncbi:hypothetical protein [Treponema vincentii]|uniref:hypothetical protein n=1 Tax=Treponema vincentii TaxID=69710 RepID=UPI001E51A512|nr:hypothetical protein [Treponema vincentii]